MNDREISCRGGSSSREKRLRGRHIALFAALLTLGAAAFPSAALALQPFIYTGPTATPSMTTASLNASIYPYGSETHYHWDLGTSTSYGTEVPVGGASAGSAPYPGISSVNQTAMGLTPNTTYHFRLVATNSDGTLTTGDQTFTTTGTAPSVTDEAAAEVAGGFELKGTVNPNGSATSYQFEYGTSAAYGSKIPSSEESVGSGSVVVHVAKTVTGLLPNTLYHFRLAARHPGISAVFTADRTFMTPTPPPSAPVATVEAPQAIVNGYRLMGAVNPDSLETTYHFEFGTSTAYGTSLPEPDESIGSGSNAVAVMRDVTGLLPHTTYHYRVFAHNSEGDGESADEQFTTPPLKPVVSTLPVLASAEGFTLNGTVNPNGGATTYHFDFGITEAYGQSIPGSEVSVGSGSSPESVSQLVKGLPPGVPYHYRIVAHSAGGTSTGEDRFFMTPAAPEEKPTGILLPPHLTLPTPPSNAFSARPGAVRAGTATLTVSVPGPGSISVSGKQIKTVKASVTAAGSASLKLKLTGAGKQAMKRAKGHRLPVKLTITYLPTGGAAGTTHKTVIFK
jgi:hypothetical protein